MSTLSQKETRRVLRSLEDQGAQIVKTKAGVRVLFPNGGTTAIHWTTSDARATKNLRADIRRNGLSWPTDKQTRRTMDPRRAETIRKLKAGLKTLPETGFTITQLVEASGLGRSAVSRLTPSLGYRLVRDPSTPKGWVFEKLPTWEPQSATITVTPHEPTPEPDEDAEYPEIQRAKELLAAQRAAEPAPPAPAEPAAPTVTVRSKLAPPQREFLDSVDSWLVEVPAELQEMATRFNLHIECRVWRKDATQH